MSALKSELDRIVYLLNIADPTGETVKKRELKQQEPKLTDPETSSSTIVNQPPKGQKKHHESKKVKDQSADTSIALEVNDNPKTESMKSEPAPTYTAIKPQWLGAVDDTVPKEKKEAALILNESDDFVDYKDREKVLKNTEEVSIENSAPGLILRKRKEIEATKVSASNSSESSPFLSTESQLKAEDAVALLLKHSVGYHKIEEESNEDLSSVDNKRPKRVIGPEKPPFLSSEPDYETWVPPEGKI